MSNDFDEVVDDEPQEGMMKLTSLKALALAATVVSGVAIGATNDAEAHTYYRTHCWRQAVHHGGHYGYGRYVRTVRYMPRAVYGYSAPAVYGYSAPAAYGYGGCGCNTGDVYGYGGDGLFGAGYGGGLFGLGLGVF